MWNNTRLLNWLATLLFAGAAFVAIQQVVLAAVSSPLFPLRKVEVTSQLEHVTREQLAEALNGRPLGNFFGADLDAVRDWVEDIPWVRRASVRRTWPDTLEVVIEEHRPLARWVEKPDEWRLVNTFGELFTGPAIGLAATHLRALPRFSGPPESEQEVTARFHRYAVIARPLAVEIVAIRLSPRYAWELRLADGLTIELGRDDGEGSRSTEERLARFVKTYPETLAKLSRRLNYVDLRYPGGFALRVPDIEKLEEEREREERLKKRV